MTFYIKNKKGDMEPLTPDYLSNTLNSWSSLCETHSQLMDNILEHSGMFEVFKKSGLSNRQLVLLLRHFIYNVEKRNLPNSYRNDNIDDLSSHDIHILNKDGYSFPQRTIEYRFTIEYVKKNGVVPEEDVEGD